jgi:magnesium-transporting ATPase (P-type)
MTALENVFLSIKRLPRHYIVTGSAWGSRILIASLQLVSIRILLEGLGAERYAVFLLMNALMNWYLLADMGVGTSLQNYLSESRGDQEASFNYQTMSSILCAGFFFIFLLILYLWSPWLSQTFLKKFDFISEHEKYRIFFVSGIIFLISGMGAIAYKSWYAQYKGYLSNVIPAVAAVIAFLLILFVCVRILVKMTSYFIACLRLYRRLRCFHFSLYFGK